MAKKQNTNKKSKAKQAQPKKSTSKPQWSIFQPRPNHVQDELYQKVFWGLFGLIAVVMLIMAFKTGVNEDDKFHYAYADKLAAYYSTFGEDKSALLVEKGKMHFYGGFIDTSTAFISRIFGFEKGDAGYHNVRHLFLAFISLLALLCTGLIGRRLGGWRAGIFAMLILFLAPRFLGHAVINPRDIPFAAGYIIAIYFMMRFFDEIPKVSWQTLAGLGGGLALAFATRSGGLLLFAYFGLFGLVHLWRTMSDKSVDNKGLFVSYLKYGAVAGFGAYLVALLFWPYGLTSPVTNVLKSLTEFSNYTTVIRMLFAGEMLWSTDIAPVRYISTWFTIGLPLVLLVGLLLAVVFGRGIWKRSNRFYVSMMLFVLLFPIAYILYKRSNLYCGMRHLLFLVPPMAVLAGVGWDYVMYHFENRRKPLAMAAAGLLGILSLLPMVHIAKNFTSTYVYFNELAGGRSGAVGNYEMDYWGIAQKQAVEYLEDQGVFNGDSIVIRTNYPFVLRQYLTDYPYVKTGYARFRERYERPWDYAVFVNHFVDGAHLRNGKFIDANVIKVIGDEDAPLCMIYKNPEDRLATRGLAASKGNRPDEAIQLLTQETANNPTNENAWNGLGQAYMSKRDFANAGQAFSKALDINPESQVALMQNGLVLLNQKKNNEALNMFTRAIKLNARDVSSKYYRAMINAQSGNQQAALTELKEVIQANPRFRQAFQLIIDIYTQMGDQQQAGYYRQLMQKYAG